MPGYIYENINLGAGAGAINAGITGAILANALNDSGGVIQVDWRLALSSFGPNIGDRSIQSILFLLPNLDVAPTLTWIEPGASLITVVSSVLTASGKTPAGIFEAFYDVTFQRETTSPLDTWYAYPVLTNTDGVAGLFPPVAAQ